MATFFSLACCILVSVPVRVWPSAYSAFTLYHEVSFVRSHFDKISFLLIISFSGLFSSF